MNNTTYQRLTFLMILLAAMALSAGFTASLLKREAVPASAGAQQGTKSYYSPNPVSSQEIRENSAAVPAIVPSPQPSGAAQSYVIGIYEGKLAVFRAGESKPFLTENVEVYLLPERDIEILKKGVTAHSWKEVKAVLEDYK